MAPSIPPYLPVAESYTPTHPELFRIIFAKGDFASSLITVAPFAKGDTICLIENTLPGFKAYSSVQVLPDPLLPNSFYPSSTTDGSIPEENDPKRVRHIELNSDLLYVNHSCDPNVAFDVPFKGVWKVRALADLPVGTIMTFAYFSTEWFMDQPFDCLCQTSRCLGKITGAKNIDAAVLATYEINSHILDLKRFQTAGSVESASKAN